MKKQTIFKWILSKSLLLPILIPFIVNAPNFQNLNFFNFLWYIGAFYIVIYQFEKNIYTYLRNRTEFSFYFEKHWNLGIFNTKADQFFYKNPKRLVKIHFLVFTIELLIDISERYDVEEINQAMDKTIKSYLDGEYDPKHDSDIEKLLKIRDISLAKLTNKIT